MDKVDLRDFQEGAAWVSHIMTRLAMEKELPMKRSVEEVNTKLKIYGLEEVMKVKRG
ncbi:hypothetical protein MUP77_02150 [Candidatus Bathyarchaeota archaeon]|nr:hypothetical protein [Candidatus Bathyarchaeota archaeon]